MPPPKSADLKICHRRRSKGYTRGPPLDHAGARKLKWGVSSKPHPSPRRPVVPSPPCPLLPVAQVHAGPADQDGKAADALRDGSLLVVLDEQDRLTAKARAAKVVHCTHQPAFYEQPLHHIKHCSNCAA